MKKLNIGCGGRPLEGYDNLDIEPKLNPDILADARNMHMIPDKTYDLVYSYGFIEHIEPEDVRKVLLEMQRVLKDGGEIQIGTEDFEFQVQLYLKEGINKWTLSAIYGPHYSHRSLWDYQDLGTCLKLAGFRDIQKLDYKYVDRKRYNFSEGILYVVARK